ncbi:MULTISPECIES: AMP-binding protein [unclassified Sphingopyxis]|uniref:AMP-binding protein n=1 Tax=unclassified Sphingopyxis TaxID=2614943 RepID=UPI00073002C0|nr:MULTISPECIES: AMP-binding protein [unclassified Sphingopyxis]KTE20329.1 acid--CoA ligase [Sphingopyxis sp. H057]KTE48977.1 acid--CoA ligase [Sphingopyxis sp. H073]KTE53261.1 acid--CoA ligase [Sphingopyxis sp. H071]KTE57925.1 acid--CoA ligase [Sphingopyxis sp. H107]KTE61672.1 acid--CoA ligase [Sphingopyxis sp. H100]
MGDLLPIGDVPGHYARQFGPDRWALEHNGEVMTWAELERRANRRAWALAAQGVRDDDIVMLSLPNGNALYELTFAIWKCGATPCVVSSKLPLAEIKAIVALARPRMIIAADAALAVAIEAMPVSFGLDGGCDLPFPTRVPKHWKAMPSGGSTGRPKIIVDHQPGVVDLSVAATMGLPEGKVVLNPGPCHHNAPFAFSHIALGRGNSLVGMTKFDAAQALALIESHKVAWVVFVPTMMNRIAKLPDEIRAGADLSSLERVWHMAAPMPPWLKQEWIDWIGAEKIWEYYGGTERQGATVISGEEWLAHRGSVGRAVECEICILGEDGQPVPQGEIGEIFLLPPGGLGSTYHYLGAAAKQAAGGYESIGDHGWLDEEGYLYLADRRTDMIVSGGANIYPAEIENALMEYPGVECAVVIGLPDDDMGARVHAIVRPDPAAGRTPNADALLAFLGDRLVRYKMPRSIEFTAEELRDDAGKVRRSALREARIAAAVAA